MSSDIFDGLLICLNSGTDFKTNNLEKLIESNGGAIEKNVTRSVCMNKRKNNNELFLLLFLHLSRMISRMQFE